MADQVGRAWQIGRQITFTGGALTLFLQHSWPGNLRELNATVTRACAYAQVGSDPSGEALTVNDQHVEMALDRMRPNMPSDPVSLLHRAATALFDGAVGVRR